MKHLYKEGGIRSIFRGTGATLARDGPGSAASASYGFVHIFYSTELFLRRYFAAYEVTKKALTPVGASPSELNLGAVILAGGTAGVAMWSIAIPPDARFFVRVTLRRTIPYPSCISGSKVKITKCT